MGQLTFLSTAQECFKNLVCPSTVIVSMLYDKDLVVPDKASAVQLEKRVKAEVPNPFNMKKLREAAKEQAKVEPPAQIWNPQIQVGKRITPAAPAVNPPPLPPTCCPRHILLLCILSSRSLLRRRRTLRRRFVVLNTARQP